MRPGLLLVLLPWLTCPASPCPSLEQSLASSDLVAEVSLVARSRAERGHYFATFRTDKILQVSGGAVRVRRKGFIKMTRMIFTMMDAGTGEGESL